MFVSLTPEVHTEIAGLSSAEHRAQVVSVEAPETSALLSSLVPRSLQRFCGVSACRLLSGRDAEALHVDASLCTLVVCIRGQGFLWGPHQEPLQEGHGVFMWGLDARELDGSCEPTEHLVQPTEAPRELLAVFCYAKRESSVSIDALIHIFSYLSLHDLASSARVCKLWSAASCSPRLWRAIANTHNLGLLNDAVPRGGWKSALRIAMCPLFYHRMFVKLPDANSSEFAGRGNIKAVFVGSSGAGKSQLLSCLCGSPPGTELNFSVDIEGCTFGAWDTQGSPEYDRLRPLSYPPTDIFLLVFSITSRATLEVLRDKFLPEVNHHMPNCSKVLVGTHSDMEGFCGDPVTNQEAEQFAREAHAIAYCKTSATMNVGVAQSCALACRAVLSGGGAPLDQRTTGKKCNIQ